MFCTAAAVQDVIDGHLKPMRSDNWDRGSLLSLRAMSFPSAYPYERVTQPVLTIIGENDKFLLKTAQQVRICMLQISANCYWQSAIMLYYIVFPFMLCTLANIHVARSCVCRWCAC